MMWWMLHVWQVTKCTFITHKLWPKLCKAMWIIMKHGSLSWQGSLGKLWRIWSTLASCQGDPAQQHSSLQVHRLFTLVTNGIHIQHTIDMR